jgi:hypothetical protein
MTRLLALIAKLWGTWVLLLWLPLGVFVLGEWGKAIVACVATPTCRGGAGFHVVELIRNRLSLV